MVNDGRLCGGNNWRVPTKDELNSLIYCSDNDYDANVSIQTLIILPLIKPISPSDDSLDSIDWALTLNPIDSKCALDMSFTDWISYSGIKRDSYYARLVSNQK